MTFCLNGIIAYFRERPYRTNSGRIAIERLAKLDSHRTALASYNENTYTSIKAVPERRMFYPHRYFQS